MTELVRGGQVLAGRLAAHAALGDLWGVPVAARSLLDREEPS